MQDKVQKINTRGGWHSGCIVIPRYYFEAIIVSYKILLNGIIAISILSWSTEDSLHTLNYTNGVRMAECHVESIVV